MHTKCWSVSRNDGTDDSGDLDVEGRIVTNSVIKKNIDVRIGSD
jgi:hypothetical protein